MSHWYALYVTRAIKARNELLEAKVEVFLPTYQRLSRLRHLRSRLRRLETVPLLDGYVFVRTEITGLRAALACESVVRVLSDAGMPREVPERPMQDLRELVFSGLMDEKLPPPKVVKEQPKKGKHRGRNRGKGHKQNIRLKGFQALKLLVAEPETQDVAEAA